jgi:hypothetical protein
MRAGAIVREEDVQATIMEGLELLGYRVLQTTHRVQLASCPTCHQRFRPGGGYGSSPGVPDLIVTRDDWPHFAWCGLEVKRPGGPMRPEQKTFYLAGRIAVADSFEAALSAIEEFCAAAGIDLAPAHRANQSRRES